MGEMSYRRGETLHDKAGELVGKETDARRKAVAEEREKQTAKINVEWAAYFERTGDRPQEKPA